MATSGLNSSNMTPVQVPVSSNVLQIQKSTQTPQTAPPGTLPTTVPGTAPQGALPGQTATLTPKMTPFAPRKEDQSILNQTNTDPKSKAGQFNGIGAAIDGYLRIAKRRYVARGAYNVE